MAVVESIGIDTDATLTPILKVNGVIRKDRFGNIKFGTPTTVKCRWIRKIELSLNDLGETISSDAVAKFEIVVEIDSLINLVSTPSEVYQIKSVDSYPDINGKAFRYSANLMRYRD